MAATAGISEERRQALLAAKLGVLVREHVGITGVEPRGFRGGAALHAGERAWFLADDDRGAALGPALTFAAANGVTELHVLAETGAGRLARRAALFDPAPRVWVLDGHELTPAEPAPLRRPPPVAAGLEDLADLIAGAGAEVVVEHGVVVGEVMGLEVARIVDGDDGPQLEVGVGRHDREAFEIIHGGVPTPEALLGVVRLVAEHRRPGAPPHPLNRLGSERWLRALVVSEPGTVGASFLAPVPTPEPRDNVKDPAPCLAAGERSGGEPVLAAFSVGIDLDLVPAAADARAADPRRPHLMVVVPERDAHPLTVKVLERLAQPAELVAVPGDWRALASPVR